MKPAMQGRQSKPPGVLSHPENWLQQFVVTFSAASHAVGAGGGALVDIGAVAPSVVHDESRSTHARRAVGGGRGVLHAPQADIPRRRSRPCREGTRSPLRSGSAPPRAPFAAVSCPLRGKSRRRSPCKSRGEGRRAAWRANGATIQRPVRVPHCLLARPQYVLLLGAVPRRTPCMCR